MIYEIKFILIWIIQGRESRLYAENRYDVRRVNAVMLKEMGIMAR